MDTWGGGGDMKLLPHDCGFPKVKLNGSIIIYHMGSKEKKFPVLNLIKPCNFADMKREARKFWKVKYLY